MRDRVNAKPGSKHPIFYRLQQALATYNDTAFRFESEPDLTMAVMNCNPNRRRKTAT
jgi:hypothetical protein